MSNNDTFNILISREKYTDKKLYFINLLIDHKKFCIQNVYTLDIQYKEQAFLGNYQTATFINRLIEHICKSGE